MDLRAEHDKQQIDLDGMIDKENVEEAALMAKADQLFKAKAQVEKTQLMMRLRIRNVLSRPQQERSVELFNQLRQEQQQQRNSNEGEPNPGARNPNRGRGPLRPPVRPPQ